MEGECGDEELEEGAVEEANPSRGGPPSPSLSSTAAMEDVDAMCGK